MQIILPVTTNFFNNIKNLQQKSFVVLRTDGGEEQRSLLAQLTQGYIVVDLASLNVKFMVEQNVHAFISNLHLPVYLENVHYVPQLLAELVQSGVPCSKVICSATQTFFLQKLLGEEKRVTFVDLFETCTGLFDAQAFVPNAEYVCEALQRNAQGNALDAILNTDKNLDTYLRLMLQRDVLGFTGLSDISKFFRFLGAVAAMTGNIINYATLGSAVEISAPTAKQWLQYLLGAGVVYELPAVHKVSGKRMIKVPKVYFKDTAVAAYLLQLNRVQALQQSIYLKYLYENYVVNRIRESFLQQGIMPVLSFYRDSNNREISVLLHADGVVYPVSISLGEGNVKRLQKDAVIAAQYAEEQGLALGNTCVLTANGGSSMLAPGIYQLNVNAI